MSNHPPTPLDGGGLLRPPATPGTPHCPPPPSPMTLQCPGGGTGAGGGNSQGGGVLTSQASPLTPATSTATNSLPTMEASDVIDFDPDPLIDSNSQLNELPGDLNDILDEVLGPDTEGKGQMSSNQSDDLLSLFDS